MDRQVFERDGIVWARAALADSDIASLEAAASGARRPGQRLANGVALPARLLDLAEALLPGARPVRIVAFDKRPGVNWSVPWHQDRVIAVAERHEVEGVSNWSRKDGVWHCEPPVPVLEAMMFARVHIDPCTEASGAMEVARGSHRLGPVPAGEAQARAAAFDQVVAEAGRGDVAFHKMLLLHRSRAARVPMPRRAVRIDFAAVELPSPLEWAG